MNDEEKRVSAALMRVNHVGEVCAQAMYSTQALATNTNNLRMLFVQANLEEFAPSLG
jgi:ubiquinone biosynthesis monooxygenase Coq7